jgi:hypothetical protein
MDTQSAIPQSGARRAAALLAIALATIGGGTAAATTEYFHLGPFQGACDPFNIIGIGFPCWLPTITGQEFAGSGLTIVQRDGHPMNVFSPRMLTTV